MHENLTGFLKRIKSKCHLYCFTSIFRMTGKQLCERSHCPLQRRQCRDIRDDNWQSDSSSPHQKTRKTFDCSRIYGRELSKSSVAANRAKLGAKARARHVEVIRGSTRGPLERWISAGSRPCKPVLADCPHAEDRARPDQIPENAHRKHAWNAGTRRSPWWSG